MDGYGNYYCIDDGNIPSLMSLPYLGAVPVTDPLYQHTREFLQSDKNPYYCHGTAASGSGGPHVGMNMIWPLGLITEGLTATSDQEIRQCLNTLQHTHAGTGFMHEAFNMDDPEEVHALLVCMGEHHFRRTRLKNLPRASAAIELMTIFVWR